MEFALTTNRKVPALSSLSTELLLQIIQTSREPSLIHTCRTLYKILPSYVEYTRDLALLAFGPLEVVPHDNGWQSYTGWRSPIIAPLKYSIGIDVQLKQISIGRDELQRELCRRQCLTPAILRATHVQAYQHIVGSAFLGPGSQLHRKQRRKVCQGLFNVVHNYDHANIQYPNFSRSSRVWMWVTATSIHRLHGTEDELELDRNDAKEEYAKILAFKVIPDCLPRDPLTPLSSSLLHTVQDGKDGPAPLKCCLVLLEDALMKAIHATGSPVQHHLPLPVLNLLLQINRSLRERCPITADMLAAAVDTQRYEALFSLAHYINEARGRTGHEHYDYTTSITDLLRLELGLQAHQLKRYRILTRAISVLKWGISAEVAENLGYNSVEDLETARAGIGSSFRQSSSAEDSTFPTASSGEDSGGPGSVEINDLRGWRSALM